MDPDLHRHHDLRLGRVVDPPGRGRILGEGFGGASAGGGGLKPVAVVVIGPDGAKVEHLKGTTASLFEALTANVKNTRWKKNHED